MRNKAKKVGTRTKSNKLRSVDSEKRIKSSTGSADSTPERLDTHNLIAGNNENQNAHDLLEVPAINNTSIFYTQRFILEGLLGVGGVCEVYKAKDLCRTECGDKNPYVAIKKLLPELKDDPKANACLIQEFYTVSNLKHKGIIKFFDIHKEPFGMCCSMELLQGTSLRDYLMDNILVKKEYAYKIIQNILSVVCYLHENNIAHGDLKPANIFINANEQVTVFDFNVASVDTAKIHSNNEHCGTAILTQRIFKAKNPKAHNLRYSSPEQTSTGRVSCASDVFSVACCIYHILEGKYPFLDANMQGLQALSKTSESQRKQEQLISQTSQASQNMSEFQTEQAPPTLRKPHNIPLHQWYILSRAMDYAQEKRPGVKYLQKCFNNKFGIAYIGLYAMKSIYQGLKLSLYNFVMNKIVRRKQHETT